MKDVKRSLGDHERAWPEFPWSDGSRKAMRYIVEHCVQDVLVPEKVIGALKAYSGTYNTYGSGF